MAVEGKEVAEMIVMDEGKMDRVGSVIVAEATVVVVVVEEVEKREDLKEVKESEKVDV